MKSTINFAILLSLASLGYVHSKAEPSVWLGKGEGGSMTWKSDDGMKLALGEHCYHDLGGFSSVKVDHDDENDPASVGCVYAFVDNDCTEGPTSGRLSLKKKFHIESSYEKLGLDPKSKSFKFSNSACPPVDGASDATDDGASTAKATQTA